MFIIGRYCTLYSDAMIFWAAPANWSTGQVPGACTAVIIPAVGVGPLVQGTINQVKSIFVQQGATVTLSAGATLVVEK